MYTVIFSNITLHSNVIELDMSQHHFRQRSRVRDNILNQNLTGFEE